jgi:ParB/RepB/Spo0J family partition protein
MTETFAHIPLAHIVASLTNPRKSFNPERLAALAESIRASGVHQPVLLRPLPGSRVADTAHHDPRPQYELVSGERRLRASIMAEQDSVPAMIRALSDSQVLDIQLVENLQRADLQPLEEAEGYERLMQAHEPPLTAEQIGARIGKSRSYVYARLKLLNLCLEGKQAMADGWLDPSTALLVARMPSHKLQADALGNLRDYAGRVLSHRDASALIERQYMLKLGEAKFKITDATLLQNSGLKFSAGSCRECPKRTGADPDLFADVKGADVCTDPPCFKAKEAAHQARQHKAARESGATIIEGREAKALVPHSWSTRIEGWLRLDDADDSPTDKPLRKLIGKQLEEEGVTPTLVANPHNGEMVAVIDHATASRLLAKKGHQEHAEAIEAQANKSAKAEAENEQRKATERYENAWRWAVLQAAWSKISGMESGMYSVPDATIRALATARIPGNQEQCKRLCKLLELGTVAPSAALADWVREHPEPDRTLALLVMFGDIEWRTWGQPEDCINQRLLDLATDRGVEVDIEAVKAQVQTEQTVLIQAKKKTKGATCTESQTGDTPLHSAAQAGGVRGEASSKGKGKKGPAAPAAKKPKTSAREALQGIAAAMQGEGEEGGADPGPSGSDQDGASAVGEEGRATSPDAGAAQTGEAMLDHLGSRIDVGCRVKVIGDQLTEKCGKVASTMGDNVFVVLDGLIADYCFQPEELLVLGGIDINSDAARVAWPFPREAAP